MSPIRVCPTQIQNGVGKFSAFLFVEVANPQEDLRNDVLVQPRLSRWRNGGIFPCDPARGVGHAAIFFGKARAGQPVNGGIDVLLFFASNSRSSPELAG